MSFYNLIVCYEEFQRHFPVKVVDHSYDDVCRFVRKTIELFREVLKEEPVAEDQTNEQLREIMKATPSTLIRGLRIIRQIKK
jgi:hypothetical protein